MSNEITIKYGIIIKAGAKNRSILITDGKKNVKLTVTNIQLMLERSDNAWKVNNSILHFLIGD